MIHSRNLSGPRKVSRWTLLLACGLIALASGCGRGPATPPEANLRLSQRNEPADLDPARARLPDEFALLRALLEGLLQPGIDGGEPTPGAAERYELSPDGLTYTFHLRPDALWSNGEPVTADDFVDSFRRMLTPSTAAPKADLFFPVRGARDFLRGRTTDFRTVGFRAIDPRTLTVTLTTPMRHFPSWVASGPWLPVNRRAVERFGRDWTRPENFVGNGPFVLAEWRPHQHLLLQRNPRWHGASRVALSSIRFVHFDHADAEERAYRAGQIEATMTVPASRLDTYARERPSELNRAPMIETRYLSFNCTRPPLDDVRVRRALALAIDRDQLVRTILRGGQTAAARFLPPALAATAGKVASADLHRHDPAAARALLAEAKAAGITLRPLELTGWSTTPLLEAVQAMWKRELGLETSIIVQDAAVHLAAAAAGRYDIAFLPCIPDVADAGALLSDFTSANRGNYPQWRDAAYDRETARALAAPDLAHTAEAHLLREAVVSPLYFNTRIWLMSPRVRGWREDGLWSRSYHTLSLDEK